MSIFSKLFKLFLTVVLMPLIPMALLLTFYQGKVKDSILGTHANLAQIVASSINQHIEDLGWRLAFGQNLAEVLRAGKDPKPVLRTALTSNPPGERICDPAARRKLSVRDYELFWPVVPRAGAVHRPDGPNLYCRPGRTIFLRQ